ncbi:MAG: hypothetical protein L6306_17740 [Planctomycetales bacterium]|nr:hypothetical protein [Planctomycetales bacterium]
MSNLPSYLAAAKPVPWANRAPWYKTIMPAYIGVMLWFVFWQDLVTGGMKPCPPAGMLALNFFPAFFGMIIAAVICHFLFYMAPAMLGMSTGLPLYVVGTSTYGARGGLYMPGFLMGLLQFGWLAVNAFFVAGILCKCFGLDPTAPGLQHGIIAAAFVILAAFVGLKGISYVGRVGTYLPLIPIVVLLILLVNTWSGLSGAKESNFLYPIMIHEPTNEAEKAIYIKQHTDHAARPPQLTTSWQIIGTMCIYVVGFFATAGAAGADIAMNSRNKDDVHTGGIAGILLPTVLAGGATMFIVVGAYGSNLVPPELVGNYNPVDLMPCILGSKFANVLLIALAISAFPGACFSSFIAANSFKTTMPKVNPLISVGLGALAAIALAVTGVVGSVIWVFQVIGASFGPVCGAMLADYLMAGRKWSGPRAGFNPAGWVSWTVGFIVGAFNLVVGLLLKWPWAVERLPNLADYMDYVPVPPVTAFVVGFALYVLLSVVGARTRKLEMPEATE